MRWLILLLIVFATMGCQIMEINQDSMPEGELEFSNVNNVKGQKFKGKSTAWYIIDLGPVYEANPKRATEGLVKSDTQKADLVVTTEFDAFDTIWRIIQMAGIFYPIVGSRSMTVEGVEQK